MSILGITNRTENWKTASSFAPFFDDAPARRNLANRLLEPLVEPQDDGEVQIELFWRGVRDQMAKESWTKRSKGEKTEVIAGFAYLYNRQFPKLREAVESFPDLSLPQEHNYRPADADREKLFNTLWHTEIDIVLETPDYLFIGEAKHESPFGNAGKLVLVHQLIRQYVTAKLLVEHLGQAKRIVPFIVADAGKLASVNNTAQVKFMLAQGWLEGKNILSWDDIAAIKG